MRRQVFVILALLALCLLVVPAAGWQDDFQSGTAYGWTATFMVYPEYPDYTSWVRIVEKPYSDTYAMEIKRYGDMCTAYANPNQKFNYCAFTTRGFYGNEYGGRTQAFIKIYSESGALLCNLPCIDCFSEYGTEYRVEVICDGTKANLYRNGVSVRSVTCNGQPYNIGFSVEASGGYVYPAYIWIDDVVIGGSEPDILGIIPEDWYVLKHPTDPYAHGLYKSDGTVANTYIMHATYGLDDPADANTRIVLQPMGSGYFLNTTYLPVGTYHGVVEINITENLINNPDAPPGYYYLKLMRGDTLLDWGLFPYTNGGGTISFDADSYVSMQTATVSHEIPIFNIQDYTYKGQIIDIYGTEKTSWPINSMTGLPL